ncbi:MAG TPA: Na+:solute symporter, partial [Flavobacteriaceae bacterium]|nr:Na+:solute symporter [Flavobacteriaceae bacterium]
SAFMSTISTHLNWGSSYVVNDFYARFLNTNASEKNKVLVGRISTFLMMICAGLLSLILEEARDAFNLLLQIGAGTGLLFILRWFWRRINPYSEITAMVVSFLIAVLFFINSKLNVPMFQIETHWQLVVGVAVTTVAWVLVTFFTKPSKKETIDSFENRVFDKEGKFHNFGYKTTAFFAGTIGIYSLLFGTGFFLYKDFLFAGICAAVCCVCAWMLVYYWRKVV